MMKQIFATVLLLSLKSALAFAGDLNDARVQILGSERPMGAKALDARMACDDQGQPSQYEVLVQTLPYKGQTTTHQVKALFTSEWKSKTVTLILNDVAICEYLVDNLPVLFSPGSRQYKIKNKRALADQNFCEGDIGDEFKISLRKQLGYTFTPNVTYGMKLCQMASKSDYYVDAGKLSEYLNLPLMEQGIQYPEELKILNRAKSLFNQ